MGKTLLNFSDSADSADEREVHAVRVAVPIFDAYVERGFTKRPSCAIVAMAVVRG